MNRRTVQPLEHPLDAPVASLRGIGPQRAAQLARLQLHTVNDFLTFFPRDYEDRREIRPIAALRDGESVCVRGVVADAPAAARLPGKNRSMCRFRVFDATGQLWITFFNAPYLRLEKGEDYIFFGRVEIRGGRAGMINPVHEAPDAPCAMGHLLPIYPAAAGLSQALLRQCAAAALEKAKGQYLDPLPPALSEQYDFCTPEAAFTYIHRPETPEQVQAARRRLIFEELFVFSCGLQQRKLALRAPAERPLRPLPPEDFFACLPFAPTGAQRRAVDTVFADLCSGQRMNRLLQGDVGSGKTLVAAAGAWLAAKNGRQTLILAPTELLARQHAETLTRLLSPFGLRVELLCASLSAAEKRQVKEAAAAGDLDVLCGTHALLQADVYLKDAALTVVDEQHRFGVEQRAILGKKGTDAHLLVMSATPIPRTLTLTLYGDLDVSRLDELPPGRQPVRTMAAGEEKRRGMLGFLQKQVDEGGQIYIVCPLIEEGADQGKRAAVSYVQALQRQLPRCRIGLMHGRLKGAEKEAVMGAFSAGALDILVSTTVVEVGVDVPNAAVMVIENAEQFGLSQLHQLRGRVGRGTRQSWCILMVGDHASDSARARLETLCRTTDGFEIAEEDLRLRGPGAFFSREQHGFVRFAIADLAEDAAVLRAAQESAATLVAEDPLLKEYPILRQRIRALLEQTAVSGVLN